MTKYFARDYTEGPFQLFSTSHLFTLIVLFAINILIILILIKKRSKKANIYFRYNLAIFIFLLELSVNIWRIALGKWSIKTSLPLHLCGISSILSGILLISKNYIIYELTYFWGLGAAIPALVTPNLGDYTFPHFVFLKYFIAHSCIITANLYMTFLEGFRPTLKSIWKVIVVTNIYIILIAIVNHLINSNYLYLCHKPGNQTLIDYMGPWPLYILTMEVVGIISILIYYSPFAIKDLVEKHRGNK